MVAMCRLGLVNSQFYRHPVSPLTNYKFSVLSYPLISSDFVNSKSLKLVPYSISPSSFSSFSTEAPESYRSNVGICFINPSNKIFSALRLYIPGAWQMPQGGIDEGEDARNAAIRELREETGVTSAEVLAEVPYWLTYDFPPAIGEKLKRQWGSDWKGQAQKWLLLRFTGTEEEINLLGDGTEKPEFEDWTWMTPQQVIEHAVDFKKPVYKEVLKVFAPHLHSDSGGQL